MVKQELTNHLAEAFSGISKQDMSRVVDALFESMAEALVQGETVELRGLCRFKIKERSAGRGRNPKAKTSVYIPKRWAVYFRPAESLTKHINRKGSNR
jgi:nucleoid DNA-binding protein